MWRCWSKGLDLRCSGMATGMAGRCYWLCLRFCGGLIGFRIPEKDLYLHPHLCEIILIGRLDVGCRRKDNSRAGRQRHFNPNFPLCLFKSTSTLRNTDPYAGAICRGHDIAGSRRSQLDWCRHRRQRPSSGQDTPEYSWSGKVLPERGFERRSYNQCSTLWKSSSGDGKSSAICP